MCRLVASTLLAATALSAAAWGCATTGPRPRDPEPPAEVRPSESLPVVVVTPPREGGPEGDPVRADPSMRKLSFTAPTGRTVTLHYRKQACSCGATNRGSLKDGRALPASGLGFTHFGANSYGTDELVTIVTFATAEMAKRYPGTAPVAIGSLSKLDGGRLRPHKSHRSGRDVDIGMYARNNRQLSTFEPLAMDQIDYEKTFFLMATLLSTGRVQSIFVNYSVQKGLYEAALDLGYDEKQLDWLFDYPQGRKSKSGVIRHARGHTRHYHVRFACPDGDTCSD